MSSSGGGASGVLGGGGCWPRRDGWDEDWRAGRRLDGEDMMNSSSIRAAGYNFRYNSRCGGRQS